MKSYRPKPRDEIARNMSAIRSTDNKTEAALRRALHALGLRFRKYYAVIPGRPDIVFPTQHIAIFVDGDYWHGRLLIEEGTRALEVKLSRLSEPSRQYWRTKFARRIERDREITALLRKDGWLVLRFWESDIRRDVDRVASRIESAVRRRSKKRSRRVSRSPKSGRAKRQN